MAFIDNDDILVLQKANGKVRRIVGGVLQPAFVPDVPVHFASERGLLGIALDPDFVLNRNVYLYYTESSTGADTSGTSTPLGNRIDRVRELSRFHLAAYQKKQGDAVASPPRPHAS
jgi:glucose/arabinose dehydrogenase